MSAKFASSTQDVTPEQLASLVKKQRETISKIEKYATYIVNGPASAQLQKRKFISHLYLGLYIGVDPFEVNFQSSAKEVGSELSSNRPVRVLHSPSNPEMKGTKKIRELINKLKTDITLK